jgi:hypothetical protein
MPSAKPSPFLGTDRNHFGKQLIYKEWTLIEAWLVDHVDSPTNQ